MLDKAELQNAVVRSKSYRQVAKLLGTNHQTVKRCCAKYGVDITHFAVTGKDNIGRKLYGLTITSVELVEKSGSKVRYYAECECECGGVVRLRMDAVLSGRVRYCSAKCTRTHNNTLGLGENNPCFRGIGKIGSVFFANIKRSAQRRSIEFNITLDYISKLYDEQQGKCALSGMDISFGRVRSSGTTASLDRIDSSKPYEPGNVQWVHKLVNRMKMDILQETYIEICRKVTAYNDI